LKIFNGFGKEAWLIRQGIVFPCAAAKRDRLFRELKEGGFRLGRTENETFRGGVVPDSDSRGGREQEKHGFPSLCKKRKPLRMWFVRLLRLPWKKG